MKFVFNIHIPGQWGRTRAVRLSSPNCLNEAFIQVSQREEVDLAQSVFSGAGSFGDLPHPFLDVSYVAM